MGRMRQHWQKSTVRGLAVMAVASAFLGCSNVDSAPPQLNAEAQAKAVSPDPTAEDFTTVGKPTKTIETPWGAREIYDPVQDEEVAKIFSKWYNENSKTYKGIQNEKSKAYNYFAAAEKVNLINYMRLGCDIRERSFDWLPTWYEDKKLKLECGKESTAVESFLTLCEAENISPNGIILQTQPTNKVPKNSTYHSSLPPREDGLPLPYQSLVLGESSGFDEAQLIEIIFDVYCRRWKGQDTVQEGWKFLIFE